MPKKLERHLSGSRSRRSIKPVSKRSSDSDANSLDSDDPGAVEEDFFTPLKPQAPRHIGIASQPSEIGEAREPTKMQKQTSSAVMNNMRRQSSDLVPAQPSEQRQFNSVEPHLHNAQLTRQTVSDKDLVEKSVVRHCQYLGEVTQIPMTFNINNRSRLLSVIDSSRRQGRLPWTPHNKHNIRLAFNAHDIRLMDQHEQAVIVRLPLHTVAAVSYLHDDLQHLVAVHAGSESDRSRGVLHIFHFSSQGAAEDMCTIISKCFDLLYTNATMAILDQSIAEDGSTAKAKSPTRNASSDQYYPNISSSLIAELHDVQRIAVPEEESSKAAPPTRASIMRQPSQDVVPVAKQPPVQQPAGTTNAPPRLNYAPLAGNIASTSPALQATPSRDVAVEVPDGPSLPPPPGPPAPSSVPAPPPAAPAMAPQPIQPIVPPSNRPALVQAVGHSRRGRATPGAGLVAVYDSEEESDQDTHQQAGSAEQAKTAAQEINEAEEAAAVVQSYMKVMHKLVSSEELRKFAGLVRDYRDNLPIAEFCPKLEELFGSQRKFMLPGMRAFIPAADQFYFESFLTERNAAHLKIPEDLLA